MVGTLQTVTDRLRSVAPIRLLWVSVPSGRRLALRLGDDWSGMDPQRGNGLVLHIFLERCAILRYQLCGRGRRAGQFIRLSSMRDPGYATNLRGRLVVLGRCTC